ncbi:MAG: hypothetical protein AAGC49_03465 [Brevundimonas sp.]
MSARRATRTAAGDAFERSAAFWLRAYPRWWREQRAPEFLAVLADIAPEADRVDTRTAAGMVWHGWRARLRARPPVWPWFGYRFFRVTLDPEHRRWMQDDIRGVLYPLRAGLFATLWFVTYAFVQHGAWLGFTFLALCALAAYSDAPQARRRAIDRALAPVRYSTRRADEVSVAWEPVPRLRARALLGPIAAGLTLSAVVGVVALVELDSWGGALPYALGVGLLLAGWMAWSTRGLRAVDQPHRILVDRSPAARWKLPAWCVWIPAAAALEVAGAWDMVVYSPVLAVAGLVLAPAFLVAAVWAPRRDRALAGVDVLRATFSRTVRVDEPRAVRYVGPMPAGVADGPRTELAHWSA